MQLRDAHLHLPALEAHEAWSGHGIPGAEGWLGLSSCHSPGEWDWHLRHWEGTSPLPFLASYGIHPQAPDPGGLGFLESLAASRHPLLGAIGECGYDFFDPRDLEAERANKIQEAVFTAQMEVAAKYGYPLVIHLRKATDRMFTHVRELKKIRSVIFHSWPSGGNEALALLSRGVNAWFSLGTPLMRGNRKTMDTLVRIPPDRLLLETDAPWQTLKGQSYTSRMAILEVYALAAGLKGMDVHDLAAQVCLNFHNALGK